VCVCVFIRGAEIPLQLKEIEGRKNEVVVL